MDYLSYEEYQEYGGQLDETEFNDIAYDAMADIDWYTFNRLKGQETVSEAVKRCMYQLIRIEQMKRMMLAAGTGEALFGANMQSEAGVTQESNDGVLTTYNIPDSATIMDYVNGKKTKQQLIRRYLNGVTNELGRKLLYKGVYPGE